MCKRGVGPQGGLTRRDFRLRRPGAGVGETEWVAGETDEESSEEEEEELEEEAGDDEGEEEEEEEEDIVMEEPEQEEPERDAEE